MAARASTLIDAAVYAPARHAPGRTLLAVLAIAVGVALGLAIYLINRTAADEVSLAARSLYGLADLAVEARADTFDEAAWPRVARVEGIAAASPELELEAKLADRRSAIRLVGVDVLRQRLLQPAFLTAARVDEGNVFSSLATDAVWLSSTAAAELELAAGDELRVQTGLDVVAMQVAGVLPPAALPGRAGLIDIATAQWRFGRLGRLSRINLRLAQGASAERVRAALAEVLPRDATLATPGDASDEAVRLSRSYRANLTALALVALFTGGFFVYSTQSLAVLRRRREFALLHALGVTRRQQLGLMLLGGGCLGVLGAALGIAGGLTVATLGMRALGADLGAGYFRGAAPALNWHPAELATFLILGTAVALIGTLRPALEAANVPTATALKAGDVGSGQLATRGGFAFALTLIALLLLAVPPITGLPLPGYAAIALLLIAVVIAMPTLIRRLLQLAPRGRGVPYELAVAELRGTARYATLSVSAIVVSFSLMVAMAIMVTSFRASLDAWTQKILPADLYVRSGYVGQTAYIEHETVEALRRLPGVERVAVNRFAQATVGTATRPLTLIARSDFAGDAGSLLWLVARDESNADTAIAPAWINEAAADLYGLAPGEPLEVTFSGQTLRTRVAGVWRDYEHQSGAVIIDREAYLRITGDRDANTVWLWLEPGVDENAVRERIHATMPTDVTFDLRAPGELRRLSLDVFDRTFAVTYILELIAVAIGLFGIASGMSGQVLARRSEFGALRHLGLTRGQIGTMLGIEGAVLGAIGVIVGLATGAVLSLILVYVINRQSFHWSMDLHAPVPLLAGLSVLLVLLAAGIAVLSGRQAMGGDVVRAVKEDW